MSESAMSWGGHELPARVPAQAGTLDSDETIAREGDSLVCTACGTTAPLDKSDLSLMQDEKTANYKTAVRALNMLLDAGAADENHPLADIASAVGAFIGAYEDANSPPPKEKAMFTRWFDAEVEAGRLEAVDEGPAWSAWEAQQKRIDHLSTIIANLYQVAGASDAPEKVLDVLANPEQATSVDLDELLAWQPKGEVDRDDGYAVLPGSFTSADALFEAMGIDVESIAEPSEGRDDSFAAAMREIRRLKNILGAISASAAEVRTANERTAALLDAVTGLSKEKPG